MDSQIWPIPPDASRSGGVSTVHIMKSQKSRSRGMPSQPPPGSTDRSPRAPAPFQPAPDSTGGSPLGSRRRSPPRPAPATSRDMQVTLVEWWLERVESKEGKIGVAGEAYVPQMRSNFLNLIISLHDGDTDGEGAFSSKPNKPRRVFRSSAIVQRLDDCTIESEDGYHIRIDGPLNISKTRENGFSEKVCECFKWDFPEQWQGLVNPKMVPDYNEHARSPAETTTAAPSPHEDVDIQQGGFSAAEVVVEENMESHDSCLKGRGRPAKGKVKRKRKGEDIPYFISLKTKLCECQKTAVENEVRSIKSKAPILVVVMKRSNVGDGPNHGNWMEICFKFATRYIPCSVKFMLLIYKEKTWTINILVYKNRKYLGGGWPKFTIDNGLRNGDICVFELKEKNNEMVTMMVHIIYGNGESCSCVTSLYGRT